MSIELKKNKSFPFKDVKGKFFVGVNWGQIKENKVIKKGFLNYFGRKEEIIFTEVDLDLAVGLFDVNYKLIDSVSFENFSTTGVWHHGDGEKGDVINDNLDNETISINLEEVSPNVCYMLFALNNFDEDSFDVLPYTNIRFYEGELNKVKNELLSFNVKKNKDFKYSNSMILGVLSKKDTLWKFNSIGKMIKTLDFNETFKVASSKNLFL